LKNIPISSPNHEAASAMAMTRKMDAMKGVRGCVDVGFEDGRVVVTV